MSWRSPTPTAGPTVDWLDALLAPFADGDAQAVGRPHHLPRQRLRRGRDRDRLHVLREPARRGLHAELLREQRRVPARGARAAADTARTTSIAAAARCWGSRCKRAGSRFATRPARHTVHRLPDTDRRLVRLRLLRGADAVELAPHLARAYLPRGARWLARLGPLRAWPSWRSAARAASSRSASNDTPPFAVRAGSRAPPSSPPFMQPTQPAPSSAASASASPPRRAATALAYHENADCLAA